MGEITEDELKLKMAKWLSKYFHVEREVKSTDGKSIIDIMLIHKTDMLKKYPIGIEVKRDNKKRGKDLADWFRQGVRYTKSNFVNYGKCLVITYPQISIYYLKEGEKMHNHEQDGNALIGHNVSTFFSCFDIGEMQKYKRMGYKNKKENEHARIVFKGQVIWSSHDDILRTNNYDRLCKR